MLLALGADDDEDEDEDELLVTAAADDDDVAAAAELLVVLVNVCSVDGAADDDVAVNSVAVVDGTVVAAALVICVGTDEMVGLGIRDASEEAGVETELEPAAAATDEALWMEMEAELSGIMGMGRWVEMSLSLEAREAAADAIFDARDVAADTAVVATFAAALEAGVAAAEPATLDATMAS